jgi:hypothetical protein
VSTLAAKSLYPKTGTNCFSFRIQDLEDPVIEKLLERWMLLPFAPGAELVVGAVVFGAVALVLRKRPSIERAPRALRLAAGVVVVGWAVDVVAGVVWVRFPAVPWWSLVTPLLLAAVGLAIVAVRGGKREARAGVPALPAVRRTWRTFASSGLLATAAVIAAVLVLVTLIAGTASIADENGALIFLPLAGGGVSTFYGWALGGPVLVGTLLLAASTVACLSAVAASPFSGPHTVQAETRQRRVTSDAVAMLTLAALALTLGGALQTVGHAGAGEVNDVVWSTGFSAFAPFFVWTGWALQVSSLAALIALAAGTVPVAARETRAVTAPKEA